MTIALVNAFLVFLADEPPQPGQYRVPADIRAMDIQAEKLMAGTIANTRRVAAAIVIDGKTVVEFDAERAAKANKLQAKLDKQRADRAEKWFKGKLKRLRKSP